MQFWSPSTNLFFICHSKDLLASSADSGLTDDDDLAECSGRVGLDRVGTVGWKNGFGTSNSLGPQDLGALWCVKQGHVPSPALV